MDLIRFDGVNDSAVVKETMVAHALLCQANYYLQIMRASTKGKMLGNRVFVATENVSKRNDHISIS